MPIVITPSGEYIDSVTGNPVNIPPQRPDLPMRSRTGAALTVSEMQSDIGTQDPNLRNLNIPPMSQQELQNILTDPNMGMEGEMARENIPANMDMGMNSEMAAADLSDVDKVRMLIDMGLSPQEAMEAIGREKAMEVRPQEFGVPTQDPGMGALSGVPAGNQAPMPMPMPRPEDLMQRQMPMGRDRTFNPNDMLRPDNAPNT